jgi:hypothetical protein
MSNLFSIPDLTAELARTKPEDAVDTIKKALRAAIKLEFATIPPYLTAMWSIRNADSVAVTIKEIVEEEMLHMGLVCNMLVGLGEPPVLSAPGSVPTYPGPLPGDVNPDLKITLRRLTPSQLKVFMDIEYPEGGPISALVARSFETIGAFYAALLETFEAVNPPLDVQKQRELMWRGNHLFRVANLPDVRKAIDLIRRQGEGSKSTPEETPGHLAHFYQFREVYVGAEYVLNPMTKEWGHTGPPVLMPSVWPMADIPDGGYRKADVPSSDVWEKIEQFDTTYTTMLRQLEEVWRDPNAHFGDFTGNDPVLTMFSLGPIAQELMQKERPDRRGTYGPCFRLA